MKGEWFEIKTAALLYLRGINNNYEFQLGSNIEQARNFDDIVFKYRPCVDDRWHTCFIQLKHKERARLDVNMLIECERGGFSLKKYLKSFTEIKHKICKQSDHDLFKGPFETCDFVIYTNAPMSKDLAQRYRGTMNLSPVENLLKSFTLNESIVKFSETSDVDIYRAMEHRGPEASEFLKKLNVFCGQPSEDEMDAVIKEELKVSCSDNMSDVDVIYRFFIEAVKQWWSEDEVNFLSHNQNLLDKAVNQYKVFTISSNEKQVHRLKIKFNSRSLVALRQVFALNCPVYSITCLRSLLKASCTKVMQILREDQGSYTFLGLECLLNNKASVLDGWRLGSTPYLVILSDSRKDHTQICQEIVQILNEDQRKRIVIVSRPIDLFEKSVKSLVSRSKFLHVEDSFVLEDLEQESFDLILDTEISLQGFRTSFRDLFEDTLNTEAVEEFFVNNIAELLNNKVFEIGEKFLATSENCSTRYLERCDILKDDILREHTSNTVFAVSNLNLPRLTSLISSKAIIGGINGSDTSRCDFVDLDATTEQGAAWESREAGFNKLCHTHRNVHWIHMDNEVILWKRSKGDMRIIYDFIEESRCNAYYPNTLFDLEDRLALITQEETDEAMTLAKYLSIKTKQASPKCWIVYANMVDHRSTSSYENSDPIRFLQSLTNVDQRPHIEKQSLELCLKYCNNVVVVLDNFHAVPAKQWESLATVINNLLETNVSQVLVTTSELGKEYLKNRLSTIAYARREVTLVGDIKTLFNLKCRK